VGFGVAANEVSESDEIILLQSPIRKAGAEGETLGPGKSGNRTWRRNPDIAGEYSIPFVTLW
jgi:hypothetical protein